ncbi:hypothetical protein C2845_PM07G05220 [Panicum miliaceum]|uniref:Rx N-terminal domain-containing protein n=1 Tax=Panicum miliaceum TaxID=4540 RepID=A0A3L6SQY9_PANMI|nr:hypothetical protein C2845_PM07G05220 [Panicum miliaceum]
MDAVISAVVTDLISRFISFILQKSHQAHRAAANNTPRLQRLLLRARAVVEEADGRRIANHGMLVQLKQLRDSMYRGFYMLDTSQAACLSRPNGSGGLEEAATRQHELQEKIMDDLEAMLADMKEFLLLLMQCPPIARQPYSTYLFMERCVFGRRMEKEHIVSFLLSPCSSLDVLPVTGPFYIGKSTLVEHACREEAVQRSFSNILRLSSDDLNDLAAGSDDSTMDGHKLGRPSYGRSLLIVELVQDTDLAAWSKLHRSLRRRSDGRTKAILISRMDRASSLGTVQALRLTKLRREEYWYFFRVLAFGSADPYDHHPSLVPIAERIAAEIDGASFMMTGAIARALRADLSAQFWGRALGYVTKSMRMHARVFGEDPRAAQSGERYLSYIHGLKQDCPPMLCYRRYKTRSLQGDTTASEAMTGDVFAAATRSVRCGDKFDFVTQSHIPPYYYYVSRWVVEKRKRVHPGNKCPKRKRNEQTSLA